MLPLSSAGRALGLAAAASFLVLPASLTAQTGAPPATPPHVTPPPPATPRPPVAKVLSPNEEGFTPLFDGKTLEGWHVEGTPGWRVENETIVGPARGFGWLRSDKQYDNFVLILQFKNSKSGNSGVFIRAGTQGRTSRTGLEIQIQDDANANLSRTTTGSLYDMVAPVKKALRPLDEWNQYEITADREQIQVRLNGELVQKVRLDDADLNKQVAQQVADEKTRFEADPANAGKPFPPFPILRERRRSGYIGLQNHGTAIAFRNIRIKPL